MTAEIAIRPAEPADLPGLLDLYVHLSPEEPRRCPPDRAAAIFDRFLAYPGSAILLGEVAGEMAASCTVVIVPNLTRGGTPYALIENVVTRTDMRGRGYGKAMLDAASEQAWAEGCYKAMLLTGTSKPATLAFYEAAGFAQSKTGFQKRRVPR